MVSTHQALPGCTKDFLQFFLKVLQHNQSASALTWWYDAEITSHTLPHGTKDSIIAFRNSNALLMQICNISASICAIISRPDKKKPIKQNALNLISDSLCSVYSKVPVMPRCRLANLRIVISLKCAEYVIIWSQHKHSTSVSHIHVSKP